LSDFRVVYDANVLYPAPLRDLLMHQALTGLFRAKWTEEIHQEWMRNVLANRPDLTLGQLERTRDLMNRAVPDCLVQGYEPLIAALTLPDPDDRHVLAAAIRAGADAIITFNRKDFPKAVLKGYGLEALHPDDFLLDLLDLDTPRVLGAVKNQRAGLRNPPKTVEELLELLKLQGLNRSVAVLEPYKDVL
jgi:predicted nucleic acid-binding protein